MLARDRNMTVHDTAMSSDTNWATQPLASPQFKRMSEILAVAVLTRTQIPLDNYGQHSLLLSQRAGRSKCQIMPQAASNAQFGARCSSRHIGDLGAQAQHLALRRARAVPDDVAATIS